MTGRDWLLVLFVGAVAGCFAYFLGRRAERRAASEAPAGASRKGAHGSDAGRSATTRDALRPAPAPPLPKKPGRGTVEPTPELDADDDEPKPPTVAPSRLAELARLDRGLDEELEEDVEPTRIGAMPKALRALMLAPVKRVVIDDGADGPEEPAEAAFRVVAAAAASETRAPHAAFRVGATAVSDPGRRRKRNEDAFLVDEETRVFVVADGMGGHRGGELASRTAVEVVRETLRGGGGPTHEDVPRPASELAQAIQAANAAILGIAEAKPELRGMGTTVCATRFVPEAARLYVAHVGDSRCYRLRDGVFTQLTSDHTMADLGLTGPESANLSRAVGIWDKVSIDLLMATPRVGDVYLLCSDGLNKMLNDDVIANVLRGEDDAKAAVDRLVLFANARGGKDNITVVLLQVLGAATATKTEDDATEDTDARTADTDVKTKNEDDATKTADTDATKTADTDAKTEDDALKAAAPDAKTEDDDAKTAPDAPKDDDAPA